MVFGTQADVGTIATITSYGHDFIQPWIYIDNDCKNNGEIRRIGLYKIPGGDGHRSEAVGKNAKTHSLKISATRTTYRAS